MPYDKRIAGEVRRILNQANANVTREVAMYGGLAFMVNEKMCVCVGGSDASSLMLRIGSDAYDAALDDPDVAPAIMRRRPVRGYVLIRGDSRERRRWIESALLYNEELVSGM